MTDHTHHDDELLSAYLDGEATPAEAGRVEADRDLEARLAELRAARDAMRQPVIPPEGARERAVARALAETDGADSTAPPVADLAEARARRRTRTRWLAVASAAAAVLVVALAIPLLSQAGDDEVAGPVTAEEEDAEADVGVATGSAGSESGTAAEAASESPAGAPTGGAVEPLPGLVDLGAVDGDQALVTAVQQALEPTAFESDGELTASAGSSHPLLSAAVRCLDRPNVAGTDTRTLLVAVATVDGADVVAYVFEQPDGTRRIVAVEPSLCAIRLERPV